VPWFWILAGPNGAGKSTIEESGMPGAIIGHGLLTLNADVRTREIMADNPALTNPNLQAAIEIDARVAANIEQGVDFLVETVLSSDKYLDDIDRATQLGYRVGMIYVGLASPAVALRRVALRQARGGHGVPADRVVARWPRSIAMLGRIVSKLDRLFVFDNTADTGPRLIAIMIAGLVTILEPGRIPEIDTVLELSGRAS
jgi:predicted ABC-type ATPase